MTRIELDRTLEKAVAEAIGVAYRSKPIKRAYKPRSPAAYHPVHPQPASRDLSRELQHA